MHLVVFLRNVIDCTVCSRRRKTAVNYQTDCGLQHQTFCCCTTHYTPMRPTAVAAQCSASEQDVSGKITNMPTWWWQHQDEAYRRDGHQSRTTGHSVGSCSMLHHKHALHSMNCTYIRVIITVIIPRYSPKFWYIFQHITGTDLVFLGKLPEIWGKTEAL